MVRLGSGSARAAAAMALALALGGPAARRWASIRRRRGGRGRCGRERAGFQLRQHRLARPRSSSAIRAMRSPTTRAASSTPSSAAIRARSTTSPTRSNSIRISAGAYTNRALAYRQQKKNDLAKQDFNQAIAVNPNDAAAYLGRGNLLRAENDFNGALADLNQAIRLNPEGAQAYHARGLIYQRQGNDVQAITDFNNAIDRDPFAGAPYQARGQSLMKTGKYEPAIEDFNAALERERQQHRGVGRPRLLLREAEQPRQGDRILFAGDSGRSGQQRGPRGPPAAGVTDCIENHEGSVFLSLWFLRPTRPGLPVLSLHTGENAPWYCPVFRLSPCFVLSARSLAQFAEMKCLSPDRNEPGEAQVPTSLPDSREKQAKRRSFDVERCYPLSRSAVAIRVETAP